MIIEIIRNPGTSFDRRFDEVSEGKGDCIIIHGFKCPGYEDAALSYAVMEFFEKLERNKE